MARTQLLHMAVHWPEQADPTLWALAVQHSVYLFNRTPSIATGLSPIDLWLKSRFPI